MKFETQAQQQGYERCLGVARQVFGETIRVLDDEPGFVLVQGSTMVISHVFPWGDDGSVLRTYAPVVVGAEMTQELAVFLLRENENMRFGGFSLGDDGTIFFNHNVVADTIDKDEFKSAILAVVTTADAYDERIVERWGGQRAQDRAAGS